MRDQALLQAIEAAGGVIRLAAICGVTGAAVSQWRRVPVTRVLAIEAVTGVPRHELRPDIYPPPEKRTAASTHEGKAA